MQKFNSVDELVNKVRPIDPIYCIRPNSIKTACNWFKINFPGKVIYAVKTNPSEKVIKHIFESGIQSSLQLERMKKYGFSIPLILIQI